MQLNAMGRRRTCRVQGFSLRFWECGTGEQLLFLHGAGLPATTFKEIIGILSRRYHVIIPELPGFGSSDFPGRNWSFEEYATLLHELILCRGYRITRIVGYSFGGGVALALARRVDTLERLVLLSPAGAGVHYRYGGIMVRIAAEAWNGLREASRTRRRALFARIAVDFLFNCARHAFLQHRMLHVALHCLRRGYRQGVIGVPSTIVTVDRDIFFPPALQERLCRSIPRRRERQLRGIHLWVLLHPLLAARVVFDE